MGLFTRGSNQKSKRQRTYGVLLDGGNLVAVSVEDGQAVDYESFQAADGQSALEAWLNRVKPKERVTVAVVSAQEEFGEVEVSSETPEAMLGVVIEERAARQFPRDRGPFAITSNVDFATSAPMRKARVFGVPETEVNGLWSIADQQARIDAARRAQRDSGQDFVIIARCDELYTSEMGGGGTGSMDEAIKRGHAYMEAGADVLFYPPRPDFVPELVKRIGSKYPLSTMGFSAPGTAFNMHTGGWAVAAVNHLKMARELMETGQVTGAFPEFPEKYELIGHPLFDGLIEEWATKTGRPTRPNHAP